MAYTSISITSLDSDTAEELYHIILAGDIFHYIAVDKGFNYIVAYKVWDYSDRSGSYYLAGAFPLEQNGEYSLVFAATGRFAST